MAASRSHPGLTWATVFVSFSTVVVPAHSTEAAPPPPPLQCSTESGWTFSLGASKVAHLENVTTPADCCAACQNHRGCGGWTLNDPGGNGCWLHGPRHNATAEPRRCGGPCVGGSNGSSPLPPLPPPPPTPLPTAPRPLAVPSAKQLDWYRHDRGAMITWNLYVNCIPAGDPDASTLGCWTCRGQDKQDLRVVRADAISRHYPYDFNVTAQVEAAASFGASYIIFDVNQMLGFALWDTAANNFSITHTPYRGGGYDIMAEYVVACRAFGIKPGIFYTANTNAYNGIGNRGVLGPRVLTPEEQDRFIVQQLTELMLGKYGDIFELWFDGGVNNAVYNRTAQFLLEHGGGWVTHGFPALNGIRWCGNENGAQHQPNWAGVNGDPLSPKYSSLKPSPTGSIYFPSAADAVLREHCWGWVNNSREPTSTAGLVDKYVSSTGQGSKLVLNIAPMAAGGVNATDVVAYRKLGVALECLFGPAAVVVNETFSGPMVAVNSTAWEQVWAVDGMLTSNVTLRIRENVTQGQLINTWALFATTMGGDAVVASWEDITAETTSVPVSIGYQRMFARQQWLGAQAWAQMKLVVTTVPTAHHPPALVDAVVYDWSTRGHCLDEGWLGTQSPITHSRLELR
eukprot:m.9310 g.9310  ORF g.9310 m.9310 type:complete len:627 (+) comp4160_c0_seq1:71-1951(+)